MNTNNAIPGSFVLENGRLKAFDGKDWIDVSDTLNLTKRAETAEKRVAELTTALGELLATIAQFVTIAPGAYRRAKERLDRGMET